MTQRERLRRAGILCCHCLRNIAFYRSWYQVGRPFSNSQFWINTNGNFLDIAVLEWCKLFADTRSLHYYSKVVVEPAAFMNQLLFSIKLTTPEFDEYVKDMKTYRDKFVAHLDANDTMNIPKLGVAKNSAKFLYEGLLAQAGNSDIFLDAPRSASRFYQEFLAQGKEIYTP